MAFFFWTLECTANSFTRNLVMNLLSEMCFRLHIQYSTVKYSKVQYSTVQYSTVQYRVPLLCAFFLTLIFLAQLEDISPNSQPFPFYFASCMFPQIWISLQLAKPELCNCFAEFLQWVLTTCERFQCIKWKMNITNYKKEKISGEEI